MFLLLNSLKGTMVQNHPSLPPASSAWENLMATLELVATMATTALMASPNVKALEAWKSRKQQTMVPLDSKGKYHSKDPKHAKQKDFERNKSRTKPQLHPSRAPGKRRAGINRTRRKQESLK